MRTSWLAALAMALPSLAGAADSETPFLPMTRAEFVEALAVIAPRMEVPALECGQALSLRRCRGSTSTGLHFEAADTYQTEDDIAAFQAGAEGMLYHWYVTAADRGPEQGAELFVGCAAALVVARSIGWGEAGDILGATFEAAGADPTGLAVNRDAPALLVVDISGQPTCAITAEWAG